MLLAGVLLALTAVSSSQSSDAPSLGDLARKQRQKQQQTKDTSAKPKKVVTDEDMPEHSEASADWASADAPHSDGPHGEISVQPSAGDVLKTGDQWKTAIARQKGTIADLKTRIDKLSSSIRFVTANAYRNGVEYNKYQAQKEQEVQRLQGELDGQKRDLEQMQENARKAGYGSAVWDP
jgi:hypothetical protein